MAPAQVLPNLAASAKKQEHLEAGKRRLEEFRKKKAADRAKKVVPVSHHHTANDDQHYKQPLDNQLLRLTDSNGAGTSDDDSNGAGTYRASEAVVELSRVVVGNENKQTEFVQNNELGSNDTHVNTPLQTKNFNVLSAETVQASAKDQESERYNASQSAGTGPQTQVEKDAPSISTGSLGRNAYGIATDISVNGNSSQTSYYALYGSHSKDNGSNLKDFTAVSPTTSDVIVGNVSLEYSGSLLQNKSGYNSPLPTGLAASSYEGEWHFSNSDGHFPSGSSMALGPSESRSTSFSFDVRSSSNHAPLYPAVAETTSRRSCPSFLDSVNIPRVPLTEPGRAELFSSEFNKMDVTSSAFEKSCAETETIQPFSKLRAPNVANGFEHFMTSSVSATNGDDMYRRNVDENSFERRHDSYSRKQDEDFAALEQHIDDLMQEKFSLQRTLEASRALAESLSTENSALTDSYNQQGSIVNQLKSDMEKLQEGINSQLMELESVKMEYANAQLECTAADERAKLLASEVISLEEKALRLRSNELKLERQLENSQAEISSVKKKMSSLEKDCQELQSTIDAMREEKKMLQDMLRKASANGKLVDVSKSLTNKKEVSTSTEDLDNTSDTSNLEMHSTATLLGSDVSSPSLLPDQIRTIQNINTLISELALEKAELMQALVTESSESSKLKELNKELSRKLEAQTQRLELLTTQSMASDIPTRPPDPRNMHDNTPYADEGDEVVEKVLGWIMKLFPGGPSRRRTSKLL